MKDQQCSQFSLSLFLAPQRLNFLAGSLAFSCFSVNGILMLLILDFSVLIIMENEDLALFPLSPPSPGVLSLTHSLRMYDIHFGSLNSPNIIILVIVVRSIFVNWFISKL